MRTKTAANKIRDGVPQCWTGRPQEWDTYTVDNLRRLLEANSDQSPCRTIKDTCTGRITPVWELRQPLQAILKSSLLIREDDTVGLRTMQELIKHKFPWFKNAQSRWFCCGHCSARTRDARLLNKSPLDIHLVLNENSDRDYHKENVHSRDLTSRDASTLSPSMWLPSQVGLELMITKYGNMPQDQADRYRHARNRLVNTQSHYIEKVKVRRVKNAQEDRSRVNSDFVTSVSDHITSIKLGIKKHMTIDEQMPGAKPKMMIFVQTFDHYTKDSGPTRTAFVVISMRDDKTGWGVQEVHMSGAECRNLLTKPKTTVTGCIYKKRVYRQLVLHKTILIIQHIKLCIYNVCMCASWSNSRTLVPHISPINVERLVFGHNECETIMQLCVYYQHWSDHGGSFPTEEVAGWVLGELPAMFKRLQAVEYNMFSSYHGKDRADSVGSMIVRWLRDQQSTDEGLKATQLSDTSGCSNSTCRSSLHRQQIYKHFVRDNRLSLRPFVTSCMRPFLLQ